MSQKAATIFQHIHATRGFLPSSLAWFHSVGTARTAPAVHQLGLGAIPDVSVLWWLNPYCLLATTADCTPGALRGSVELWALHKGVHAVFIACITLICLWISIYVVQA